MCSPLSKTVVWRQKVGFSPSFLYSSPRRYADVDRKVVYLWLYFSKFQDTDTDAVDFVFTLRDMLSVCLGRAGVYFTASFSSTVFLSASVPVFASHPSFFPSLQAVWTCPVTST